MSTATRLARVLELTTLAASTVRELAHVAAHIPFLVSAAAMTAMILELVEKSKISKERTIQMLEQVHEVLCAILGLYEMTAVERVLPPGVVHDIGNFAETLQNIYSYLKTQQEMGKIKQIFKQADSAAHLEACRVGLQNSVTAFRMQVGAARVADIAKFQNDIEHRHEELMELLARNSNLTSLDLSSIRMPSSLAVSSEFFSMLPASPKMFYGREAELRQVLDIITQESPRIVLLGPGGMGKTSLALAALHDAAIIEKYHHRYFVSCHVAPTCSQLASTIALHIGVDHGPNLARKIIRHLSCSPSALLVLDNFETPWESSESRAEVEEFLSLLADVPQLAILVTMRGAERPGGTKWTRPHLPVLSPLSQSAAFQTFIDIANDPHDDNIVQQLLDLTGNLPLAISLIANVATYEGCATALARWETESTRLLSDGYDKASSLDVSIMLSLSSARMTAGAHSLLSLLSMLPDGLSDADLVQSKIPLPSILSCKATLLRTTLAYVDHDQRLKVLVPIREYVFHRHHPDPELRTALLAYFHEVVLIWDQSKHPSPKGSIPQLSGNLGNICRIIIDALDTCNSADITQTLHCGLILNSFYREKRRTFSPVLLPLSERMLLWEEDLVYGEYCIELLHSLPFCKIMETETLIERGNQYFTKSSEQTEKARWHNALGQYYFTRSDHPTAKEHRKLALTAAGEAPSIAGRHALQGFAQILVSEGDYVRAMAYSQSARQYANSLGDMHGEAHLLAQEAYVCTCMGDFQKAAALCRQARELIILCGLEGGAIDLVTQSYEADVHLLRTEYREARLINERVANSRPVGHLPTAQTAFAHINIALIDVAIGAQSTLIRRHIDIARHQFSEALAYPLGGALCEMIEAELHLLQGNSAVAHASFASAFLALRDKLDEGAIYCLERLADADGALDDLSTTLRWAVLFLVYAMRGTNKLATMKALRCLGDVSMAHGDEETAVCMFEVAQDGFEAMGVHRWRGDCMVRRARVLERRGSLEASQALLRDSRPLFEPASQQKQVNWIDAKLPVRVGTAETLESITS